GRVLEASRLVIDARGPLAGEPGRRDRGFLKFLGLEMRLARGAAPERPLIMDATVAQHDGFRFFYVLPLGPDHLLVEDNYYSDTPALDAAALRERVGDYVRARGWEPSEVVREESGVLPLPWRPSAPPPPSASPLVAGYR